MSAYELRAALRMADEISGNLRRQIVESCDRLKSDAACEVRSQYCHNLLGSMHDWALSLNAWMAIADSLRRRLPEPAQTQSSTPDNKDKPNA